MEQLSITIFRTPAGDCSIAANCQNVDDLLRLCEAFKGAVRYTKITRRSGTIELVFDHDALVAIHKGSIKDPETTKIIERMIDISRNGPRIDVYQ